MIRQQATARRTCATQARAVTAALLRGGHRQLWQILTVVLGGGLNPGSVRSGCQSLRAVLRARPRRVGNQYAVIRKPAHLDDSDEQKQHDREQERELEDTLPPRSRNSGGSVDITKFARKRFRSSST
jgi:hypothetical protein